MVCAFFGHRDTPSDIKPLLRDTLIHLITAEDARMFYVGNQGAFDRMVIRTLSELKKEFSHISLVVVLPYLPTAHTTFPSEAETVFPTVATTVPRRYAIERVNHWMIEQSDTVISYITHTQGGAAKFVRIADNKKKRIVALANEI